MTTAFRLQSMKSKRGTLSQGLRTSLENTTTLSLESNCLSFSWRASVKLDTRSYARPLADGVLYFCYLDFKCSFIASIKPSSVLRFIFFMISSTSSDELLKSSSSTVTSGFLTVLGSLSYSD